MELYLLCLLILWLHKLSEVSRKAVHAFALWICRTCMVSTPQSQEYYSESECTVRTPENYEEQCLLPSGPSKDHFSTTYGINRRSVLEDVPDFSVTTGLPHDIMHDLYEGVVPYELKLLINNCVTSGYFTIAELSDHISGRCKTWTMERGLDRSPWIISRPHTTTPTRLARRY